MLPVQCLNSQPLNFGLHLSHGSSIFTRYDVPSVRLSGRLQPLCRPLSGPAGPGSHLHKGGEPLRRARRPPGRSPLRSGEPVRHEGFPRRNVLARRHRCCNWGPIHRRWRLRCRGRPGMGRRSAHQLRKPGLRCAVAALQLRRARLGR